MKKRILPATYELLALSMFVLVACGGSNSSEEANSDNSSPQSDPELPVETQPEPVLGDDNGNGVADGFEVSVTGGSDQDGDSIDDRVDHSFVSGEDMNNNGVMDLFEAREGEIDDVNADGVMDFAFPPPKSSGRPALQNTSPGSGALLVMDFEDGTAESNIYKVNVTHPTATDAITISDSVSRSGTKSLRTLIRYTDDYITFDRHRAESASLTEGPGLDNLRFGAGQTWTYEFSLLLDDSWQVDTKRSDDIVWQFKSWEFGWPSMIVVIEGAEINLRIAHPDRLVGGSTPDDRVNLFRFYRVGEWMDFRFEIKFSDTDDGYVNSSVRYASTDNYTELPKHTGRNLLQDGPCCTYLKWGIYKPVAGNTFYPDATRITFHDDIRVYRVE